MGIVSIADVKTFLGIGNSPTTQDAQIGLLVDSVSQAIDSYVKRSLAYEEIVEKYDGTGSPWLILKKRPVISLTSVVYTDPNGLAFTIPITDYIVYGKEGMLRTKLAYQWYAIFIEEPQAWTITYKAGYIQDDATYGYPNDIRLACLIWVGVLLQKVERKLLAVSSESIGDQNVSYIREAIPTEAVKLLSPYVNRNV